MGYSSETVRTVLSRINHNYFLPALQREFVWTAAQVSTLFDSLMRKYPISSFLLWEVPKDARDEVEAYEFLHRVSEWGNRARIVRVPADRELVFVLDGQQRLTSLYVGLQGTYSDRRTKSGKGSKTYVDKKLFLDLLHDGRVIDPSNGEAYYHFDFFEHIPVLQKNSYWFEVGRILRVESEAEIKDLIARQLKSIKDLRPLTSKDAEIVEHNLRRLYEVVWIDESVAYYTEHNSDPERILEIFVRANSGGTVLNKSDLLLSTLTLHWGSENAREEINGFVEELNTKLARKNRLSKDFVMKSCLVLLNLPVAYRVSSFTKATCATIKERWDDIRSAIRRAVDAANAFGIDESTLTSANALIPLAYYLFQHPKVTLRGESAAEIVNASRARIWLVSALLNGVLGGSSDSMLTSLRSVLQRHYSPDGNFPIAALDKAVRDAGRIAGSSEESIESVLNIQYGDDSCFLALSLIYEERNWGVIPYSIDHLFARDMFKKLPDGIKEHRDDFANLVLIKADENSAKQNRPLAEWVSSRDDKYLERHFIPKDRSLWEIARYEEFLIERQKLLRARLQEVFSLPG